MHNLAFVAGTTIDYILLYRKRFDFHHIYRHSLSLAGKKLLTHEEKLGSPPYFLLDSCCPIVFIFSFLCSFLWIIVIPLVLFLWPVALSLLLFGIRLLVPLVSPSKLFLSYLYYSIAFYFCCCPIMCLYVLDSALSCPLRFPHKNNDVLFVFTSSCL